MSHKTPLKLFLCSLLVLAAITGCKKPSMPAPPPPQVTVIKPVAREVMEWDEYTGRLEAKESVEVRARVSGNLDKVHFAEGKEVKAGDLLFTIDPRPYQADYDHAEAEFQRAVSQEELAKNDFERAKRLITAKAISEEDFDTQSKNFAQAQAASRSAKATLDAAKLNLDFTEIHSPIDGRISRALITEGNLVNGGSGTSATLLTTIVSLDPMYCYVDVDERAVLKYIRLGKEGKRDSAREKQIPAEFALPDEEGFPHQGYIDFVDNRVDPSTGTLKARGVFANADHTISPGFFVRLRVPGSGKYSAVLLPERAFGSDQSDKFVYVVNAEKKVEYRPVKLGALVDGLRVVLSGVQTNDLVITEGLMRVRPGVMADPQPPVATKPSTSAH